MSPSVSVRLLLTQSDARLVAFASAGHERAFEALVQRYRRQLLGYCRRLLLSGERAEDALQQALLQAWLALRDGAQVSDAQPWLYRIVHNCAIDALRASGYDFSQLNESLTGAGAPQEDLDRRIAVREALAGLAALPQMQREALLRTAVEGGTHEQVAQDLGLSEPALRGLVYRARVALRAAAGAIVPPPAVSWALEAGSRGAPVFERIAGVGAGGGSAGLAGLLMKGGAVAVTAGALAGGIVVGHPHHDLAGPAAARAASLSSGRAAQGQSGAGARAVNARGADGEAASGPSQALRTPTGVRTSAQPWGPRHDSSRPSPAFAGPLRGDGQTGASHERPTTGSDHGQASKDGSQSGQSMPTGSSTLKPTDGGKGGSSGGDTSGSGGSTGSTGGDGSSGGSSSGDSKTSEPTTSTQDGSGSSGGSGGGSDGGTQTQPTGRQMSSPDGSGTSGTTGTGGKEEAALLEAPTDK